jgi:RNA polymerase sigma factor (sigma-70 family)
MCIGLDHHGEGVWAGALRGHSHWAAKVQVGDVAQYARCSGVWRERPTRFVIGAGSVSGRCCLITPPTLGPAGSGRKPAVHRQAMLPVPRESFSRRQDSYVIVARQGGKAGSMSPVAASRKISWTHGGDLGQWLEGAQRGDPVAMDGLLRALLPTARRFAARSCPTLEDAEDAEDAAQDALFTLVRRVGALRAAEAITSWLFVTIRNACLRRVSGVILVPLDMAPEPASGDLADVVVDRVVVAEALAGLPAAQRDVIVLIDLLGLSAERAGERLGIGVCATKSRLHRARRALAASLASPPSARKTA